jgi:DNA-binding YbaB/EbfC family protein
MNLQQLMQQAQKMQKQMQDSHEKMKTTYFSGDSANGKIKITMNGVYEVKNISIDKSLVNSDEIEIFEDLLVVAFNNCRSKVENANKDTIGDIANNGDINALLSGN